MKKLENERKLKDFVFFSFPFNNIFFKKDLKFQDLYFRL